MRSKNDNVDLVVNSFDFLLTSDFDVIFVDIEGTLLAPNMFCELLVDKYFYQLFLKSIERNNVIDYKISEIIYIGKNFQRILMNDNIPEVFKKLQASGKKIFALSSGFRSIQKVYQIGNLGINFDKFLFTKRGDKGEFLLKFFEGHPNLLNHKMCVIDNHLYKLSSIQNVIRNIDCKLILYDNKFVPDVTFNSFVKYWQNVLDYMAHFKMRKKNHNNDKTETY